MICKNDVARPLLALAGLLGAAGVALAARGSHAADANMTTAATFLLIHAPVLLALSFLKANRLAQIAAYVLAAAVLLFSGDLALRSTIGAPLFPFAAPIGGGGLIIGWLLLSLAAIIGWRRT